MLSEVQFSRLSNLLKDETAVVLGSGKEYLVESRLNGLMRDEGFGSLSELIDVVLQKSDPALNQKVLLALTTNETSFFRDSGPFELLRNRVIPALIAARSSNRNMTLWSAACSTGQEPYSLAMLIREAIPDLDAWKIKILASDLNPAVVAKGRGGIYTALETNRGLSSEVLERHFTPAPGERFVINQNLRSMVEFFEHNLIASWAIPSVDILFMRNVLIYFDTETKRQIFEKIRGILAPDGYLFLGTAESPYRIVDGFKKVEGAGNVYQLDPDTLIK